MPVNVDSLLVITNFALGYNSSTYLYVSFFDGIRLIKNKSKCMYSRILPSIDAEPIGLLLLLGNVLIMSFSS